MAPNLHLPANNQVTSMKPTLFRRLLVVAIIAFSAIWLIDSSSGIISSFDAIAYPICIACFTLVFLLSKATDINDQKLHLFTYFIVAGYLISTSIWHHMDENGLFSNAAQWLGLNYVIAYLFLEVKKAAPTTVFILLFTLVGHYAALIQNHSFSDTVGVVLNIGIAHIIYIILLWTVIKLRVSSEQVSKQVDILENYAYIDVLTRILNRRGIEKVIKELGLDEEVSTQEYAILIVDIDYFKRINDEHGHLMGDKVLANLAGQLSRSIHPNDLLGRWGGEEFIIITLKRSPEQVFALAEKIRLLVSTLDINGIANITVSIGVAHSNKTSSTTDVFKRADSNLYLAKQSGRNNVISSHFPT